MTDNVWLQKLRKPTVIFGYDMSIGPEHIPNNTPNEYVLLQWMWHKNNNTISCFHDQRMHDAAMAIDNGNYGLERRAFGHTFIGPHPEGANPELQKFNFVAKTIADIYQDNIGNYIYPINSTPHFERMVANKEFRNGYKNQGEFFFKTMSEYVKQDVYSGRCTLYFEYVLENYISKEYWEDFHEVLQIVNFPKEQILVYLNSFNAKELYESWFPENERMCTVVNCPYLLAWNYDKGQRVSEGQVLATKNKIRNHHFTFKMNTPSIHRQHILLHLSNQEYLEKANWSCLQNIRDHSWIMENTRHKYPELFDHLNGIPHEDVDKIQRQIPKLLIGEEEQMKHNIVVHGWSETNYDIYLNSYFDICCETYADNQNSGQHHPYYLHESITEKVYKPMAFWQPFIFVSWPGALKQLRNLGFKTFSPFIDESYDDEIDYNKRMIKIMNEIDRLMAMSKEELHDWYWSQWDILKHNHDLLSTTADNPLFLESLQILADRSTQL